MRDDALLLAYAALLLALLASLLLGCHASSLTGPSATAEEHAATWHGARVTNPALLPLLDRAAPTVAARWPGWRPVGWTIESTPDLIPAPPDFLCGPVTCGQAGYTTLTSAFDTRVRLIRLSLAPPPDQVVRWAAWELCNAARWDVTHGLADRGCGP